jgi:hypothetical protein
LAESKSFGKKAWPVVVAISQGPATEPGSPPPPENQIVPRMVVLGFDNFNDKFVRTPQRITDPRVSFEMFGGLVDWLRERPIIIGIEAREHKMLTLPANLSDFRLIILPSIVMVGLIAALGLSIWVVRRS